MEENKIVCNLADTGGGAAALQQKANEVKAKLASRFSNAYDISADDFKAPEKDWSHEIKLRKGDKIGASVDMKWEKSTPDTLVLEVSESSKLGSTITIGVLVPALLIGAYMGYNDIEPFDMLPGKRIAAVLAGLFMLIPGLIVVAILKSIMLKSAKDENAQLVREVTETVRS